jgi:import inner membrane translocase subunit TIM50
MLARHLLRVTARSSLVRPLSSPLTSAPFRQPAALRSIHPTAVRWSHDGSTKPPSSSAQNQKPLPDLRQGIPSTFAQEFGKQDTPKDDVDLGSEPQDAGGGKELPKAAYESSIDRRRNRMAQWFFILATAGIGLAAFRLGRNWSTEAEEEAHPDAPSGWAVDLMWKRIRARVSDQMGYYTEPTFPKLLPPVDQIDVPVPPYTLVISLEDMLVHEDWSRKGGYRVAKRPGMDFFLMYLSQYYELCLFTSVPFAIGQPVQAKVDPYHFIMWNLFREATRYDNGDYVKVRLLLCPESR